MKHLLLLLTIAAAMMSCEKPEDDFIIQNADNPIISSIEVRYQAPSTTSKSADPVETLIIDGIERDFDLEGDHFYDDGRDSDVHFSQTYITEVDGQLLRIYFSVLVNIDTNEAIESNFVEVSTRDNEYQIIDIINSNVRVNEANETITYSSVDLSFSLTL